LPNGNHFFDLPANFGRIQVHERIKETSRELLMQIKELAEGMGFEVLHGIVDACGLLVSLYRCSRKLWRGRQAFLTEVDFYD